MPWLIWLQERCDECSDTLINEVSAKFPKDQINALFRKQFRDSYQRVVGDAMNAHPNAEGGLTVTLDKPSQQLRTFLRFTKCDWVAEIRTAVQKHGVPKHDIDRAISRAVVHLLLKPGDLFKGWDGRQALEERWTTEVNRAVKEKCRSQKPSSK